MPLRSSLIGLLAFFLASAGLAEPTITQGGQLIRGKVTRHADGDTLTMAPDSGEKAFSFRMVGIDTPELHLPDGNGGSVSQGRWAEEAAARLKELAPKGSSVTLETWGAQSYGRAIGRVLDSKGNDVNLALVEEGWAAAFVLCTGSVCKPGFLENQDVAKYMAACDRAVSAGLGIYDPADPLPEQPFEFRMRIEGKKPRYPVGDLKTGKLYAADRYDSVPVCRRIFFGSNADAARMGFQNR